jgi:hypothetical protein
MGTNCQVAMEQTGCAQAGAAVTLAVRSDAGPLAGYAIHSSRAAFAELVLMDRAAWPLSYVARIGTDATWFSHSSWIVPVFRLVVIV